jgi:3-dehydroquinate synthase
VVAADRLNPLCDSPFSIREWRGRDRSYLIEPSMNTETVTARVNVSPGSADRGGTGYDVLIGPGLLGELVYLLRDLGGRRYAIIADSTTGRLFGKSVKDTLEGAGASVDLLTFTAGEPHKTRASWIDLSDRMLALKHGRDSIILALGGGVTGDLAGFVAATYMRGLPLVQLPTTLLAMIDSSVGGKTGVDTAAGKNLIGAFHQPRLVVADTDTLRSLPHSETASGMAEAVKHGAIMDEWYFDWISASLDSLLRQDAAAMAHLIRRSVEIKADVVGADEREAGLRKVLNFGHTIGHAIEARSGFSLLHGESIAIGMVVEAILGEEMGVTERGSAERLRAVLSAMGLPTGVPVGYDPASIVELTRLDKKARGGRVEYSLIQSIGAASPGTGSYGTPIDDAVVLAALHHSRTQSTPVN